MTHPLVRSVTTLIQEIQSEGGQPTARPCRRVAVCATIRNPLAGAAPGAALDPLIDLSEENGQDIALRAVDALGGQRPRAYGKAALVGLGGDPEHGAAMIHARLGRPIRIAAGGGPALIPGNCKLAAPGSAIDVPLGGLADAWDCDAMDTITVQLPDAPRPDEIVVIVVVMAGTRPNARVPGADPQTVAALVAGLGRSD